MRAPADNQQAEAAAYLAGVRELAAGSMLSADDRARFDRAAAFFAISSEQVAADVRALGRLAKLRADLATVEGRRAADAAAVEKAQLEIKASMESLQQAREIVAKDQARTFAAASLRVEITSLAAEILEAFGADALDNNMPIGG